MPSKKNKKLDYEKELRHISHNAITILLLIIRSFVTLSHWLNSNVFVDLFDAQVDRFTDWYNLSISRHKLATVSGLRTGIKVESYIDEPLYSMITFTLDPEVQSDPRCDLYVRQVVAHTNYVKLDSIEYSKIDANTSRVIINHS